MRCKPLITSGLILALLAAGGAACAATPPVGISVAAQLWNPLQPAADTPTSVVNAPAGISGPMNFAWDMARKAMMDVVPKALKEFDLGAGFRLYDVTLNVNPLGPITLASVAPVQAGDPSPLRLHWTIPATHMSVKLRTPGSLPGALDPGFSATVDLDLQVAVALSDTPGQTFKVTEVRVVVPTGGMKFQSDTPGGDIVKALADFGSEAVTGKSLNALLNLLLDDQNFANGKQNALAQYSPDLKRIDLAKLANQQLLTINQAIKVPVGYVHIGQWLKPAGGGQMLSLVFAPRNLPLPPQTATVQGSVNFSAGTQAAPLPTTCTAARFSNPVVQVQSGPRPVLDVAPYRYGEVPLQTLNAKLQFGSAAPDPKSQRCDYQLTGLVAGWPNQIAFSKPAAKSSSYGSDMSRYWSLAPQGWSSPLMPGAGAAVAGKPVRPGGSRFDLLATSEIVGGGGLGVVNPAFLKPQAANPGDPATRLGATGVASKSTSAFDKAAAAPAQTGQIKQNPWGGAVPAAQVNAPGKAAAAVNEIKTP
jgi:hypothetical protein